MSAPRQFLIGGRDALGHVEIIDDEGFLIGTAVTMPDAMALLYKPPAKPARHRWCVLWGVVAFIAGAVMAWANPLSERL